MSAASISRIPTLSSLPPPASQKAKSSKSGTCGRFFQYTYQVDEHDNPIRDEENLLAARLTPKSKCLACASTTLILSAPPVTGGAIGWAAGKSIGWAVFGGSVAILSTLILLAGGAYVCRKYLKPPPKQIEPEDPRLAHRRSNSSLPSLISHSSSTPARTSLTPMPEIPEEHGATVAEHRQEIVDAPTIIDGDDFIEPEFNPTAVVGSVGGIN